MDRAVACKQPHASFEIVNKDGGTTTFENKATGKRMCEIINEARGNIEFFDRSSGGKLYLTNTKNSSRIAFLNRSTPGDAQIGNFKGKFTCDTVGPNKDLKISAGKVFNNARFDLGLCKLKIAKRLETDTASKISISFQGSKLFGSIQAGKGAFLDGLLVVMGNKKVRPGRYVLIKSNAGVSNGFSATRLLGFSLALDVKVVRKANKVELVLTEK